MDKINIENLYFDEPRLKLIHFSRFLARLISYSLYSVLIVSAITFLLSEADNLFWLGILISLFLVDFLIQLPEIQKGLIRMDVNLDEFEKRIEEIGDSEENRRQKNSKADLLHKAEMISKFAVLEAFNDQNKFIEPHEFFAALSRVKDEKISSLFNLF